ncbi:MAG TPA: sigma 54-interacting transcriptional regulator, partial [Gemmatimonadaceae bacterium]|nr:sigma 54-interacting transcriptional regulator [Gemmatimonadaceae bacterium]
MSIPFDENDFVGDSLAIRRLRELVATIAPTRVPVLIEGATGTGKELIAALVHRCSRRSGKLVAFNVCAFGEAMFEDSLFGHVRGAYTGAIDDSLGLLREADGGTAFFDEISGLPLSMQAKLLRAVETGVFRPIGAARDAQSDFRLVAATNDRLGLLVDSGRFRADLKHRISGVTIHVPSLCERVDDIPALASHFARRATGREMPIDARATALLMDSPWPGNVRELKQVVEIAAAFARDALDEQSVQTALTHRASPLESIQRFESIPDRVERRELVDALQLAAWDVDRAAADLRIHR